MNNCLCNLFGGDNIWWIIIVLIILFACCGNNCGSSYGNNGCGCGC